MMAAKSKILALYIIPMITGSISFTGSATITAMILLSRERFETPYRRIVFGLSVTDTIQSLAMVIGPFAIPKGTENALWAFGNTKSCDAQGFAVHLGFAGVPMYTLCLCIYYYCMIKLNMSDKDFSRKVEPYLHVGSIAWTLVGGFICLSSGSFNVLEAGNMCWYTPLPADCVTNDEVECIRGSSAFTYGWIFGGSNFLTLCGIIYCLYTVCRCVILQEKKNDRYRFRGSVAVPQDPPRSFRRISVAFSSLRGSGASSPESVSRRVSRAFSSLRNSMGEDPEDPLAIYRSRSMKKSMKRRRETMTQAICYIGAFVWTCMWAYLYGFLVTVGIGAPYAINVLLVLFYPLGGFLNLLVFTRPKVRSVRKKVKSMSWFRAFLHVIRAGGNLPDESTLESVSDEMKSSNVNNSGTDDPRASIGASTTASGPLHDVGRKRYSGSRVSFKCDYNEEEKEELKPPSDECRGGLPANVAVNWVETRASLESHESNINIDVIPEDPPLPNHGNEEIGSFHARKTNDGEEKDKQQRLHKIRSLIIVDADSNHQKLMEEEEEVAAPSETDSSLPLIPINNTQSEGKKIDDTPMELSSVPESDDISRDDNDCKEQQQYLSKTLSLNSDDVDSKDKEYSARNAKYANLPTNSRQGEDTNIDDTPMELSSIPESDDVEEEDNDSKEQQQCLNKIRSLISIGSDSNYQKLMKEEEEVTAPSETDSSLPSNPINNIQSEGRKIDDTPMDPCSVPESLNEFRSFNSVDDDSNNEKRVEGNKELNTRSEKGANLPTNNSQGEDTNIDDTPREPSSVPESDDVEDNDSKEQQQCLNKIQFINSDDAD